MIQNGQVGYNNNNKKKKKKKKKKKTDLYYITLFFDLHTHFSLFVF